MTHVNWFTDLFLELNFFFFALIDGLNRGLNFIDVDILVYYISFLRYCPKTNPNFCDITWNVEGNDILLEIFRVVSRCPRTFHVISRKIIVALLLYLPRSLPDLISCCVGAGLSYRGDVAGYLSVWGAGQLQVPPLQPGEPGLPGTQARARW